MNRYSTAGAMHLLIIDPFIKYPGALGDHALPWRLHLNGSLHPLLYACLIFSVLRETKSINFIVSIG